MHGKVAKGCPENGQENAWRSGQRMPGEPASPLPLTRHHPPSSLGRIPYSRIFPERVFRWIPSTAAAFPRCPST